MFKNDYTVSFQRSWLAAGAAVVSAGVGIYKTVKSSNDQKKQRKALEEEKRNQPKYEIPEAFEENRNISASNASQGLGSSAKDFYKSLVEGGLTSSLTAAQSGGGGVNSLQELMDSYNRSAQSTAAADAQLKRANIGDFIKENTALAGQQLTKNFGVPNIRANNNIAQINNAIFQDQQGINSGLSDITGSLASFVASGALNNMGQQRQLQALDTQRLAATTDNYNFGVRGSDIFSENIYNQPPR